MVSSSSIDDSSNDSLETNVSEFLNHLQDLRLKALVEAPKYYLVIIQSPQCANSEEKARAKKLEEEIEEAKRQRLLRRQGLSSRSTLSYRLSSNNSANNTPAREKVQQTKIERPLTSGYTALNNLSSSPPEMLPDSPLAKRISVFEIQKQEHIDMANSDVSHGTDISAVALSKATETNGDSNIPSIKSETVSTEIPKIQEQKSFSAAPILSPRKQNAEESDKDRDMAAREEERLSKFLRSPSQRTPVAKDKLQGTFPSLAPSPSRPAFSRSPSPVISPASDLRHTLSMSRSPSTSPERQKSAASVTSSPFRSNRYSTVGTFASSDFYNGKCPSPIALERGIVNVSDISRPSSAMSTNPIPSPSNDRGGSYSPVPSRSPSPTKLSSPFRPSSPTKAGNFVHSALRRENTISKRMSMISLRPAPIVLGSSSPIQASNAEEEVSSSENSESSLDSIEEKEPPASEEREKFRAPTSMSVPRKPLPRIPNVSTEELPKTPERSLSYRMNTISLSRSPTPSRSPTMIRSESRIYRERNRNNLVSPYSQSTGIRSSPSRAGFVDLGASQESKSFSNPQSETIDDSNKENAGSDRDGESSPTTSRRSPSLSTSLSSIQRSPSRAAYLHHGKRWSPNKSSWLENALLKSVEGVPSPRPPAVVAPKDEPENE
ncbi:hypothetical protein V1511DRAFT_490026 [Dipodascopsis uninucleata]